MTAVKAQSEIEDFIAWWTASSGNERANFQLFSVEPLQFRPDRPGRDIWVVGCTFSC
jgi:hypothetical protein